MFCVPRLIFGGNEGIGSRFHVLRARTHFRRYRGHRVPFSCFARPDSFSAVPSASGPVLRSRTHFRQYRARQVPFSCFARLDSFLAIQRASGPIFKFCAPGLIFGGTEGNGSRFLVLCSWTSVRQSRVCKVPFSCFARSDSLLAITRASGPVFMFCAPELVFGGVEGVGSRFHVLRSQTRFRRC
jgi:hypothetical protein